MRLVPSCSFFSSSLWLALLLNALLIFQECESFGGSRFKKFDFEGFGISLEDNKEIESDDPTHIKKQHLFDEKHLLEEQLEEFVVQSVDDVLRNSGWSDQFVDRVEDVFGLHHKEIDDDDEAPGPVKKAVEGELEEVVEFLRIGSAVEETFSWMGIEDVEGFVTVPEGLGLNWEVPSTTGFEMREKCSVNLYQDAAVSPHYPPPIVDSDGNEIDFIPGECWESIYNAINEAERFIYITGWSLDVSQSLLRSSPEGDETIGELLRRKADEGCVVLIHIWNEKMSVRVSDEQHTSGLMCTHDEAAKLFFEDTPVHVISSYRHGESRDHSFVFTHHQKSVIVDVPLVGDAEKSRLAGEKKKEQARKDHFERKKIMLGESEKWLKKRQSHSEEEDEEIARIEADRERGDFVDFLIEMKLWEKEHQQTEEKEDGSLETKVHNAFNSFFDLKNDDTQQREKEDCGGEDDAFSHWEDPGDHADKQVRQNGQTRRIVAFVGGLDLCDGRWDTPQHSLYRTLENEHVDDFHNPWGISELCGPREPWHDIHSKLEGRIARDVLRNFEERWLKQAPPELHGKLLDFRSSESGFLKEEDEVGSFEKEEDSWNVQFFRSIDPFSAVVDKIDASIHDCYLNAIRKAEKFIYIENQYFLGSCENWVYDKTTKCANRIPFEIASKIASKIREKQQFNAYILIPMYPEGVPEDLAIQEILQWQHQTQAMMYSVIHQAIEETYGDDLTDGDGNQIEKPLVTDYLNFYCLGNKETERGTEAPIKTLRQLSRLSSPPTQKQLSLFGSRRFSIYVHSKMMIVDDVYVVVGSANINDRSMVGFRDTEMAVGAYQPFHQEGGPKSEVHKFRMSLWSEHIGESLPLFVEPNSVECARYVNSIAKRNWDAFISEEMSDLPSHLLLYPIRVDEKGDTYVTEELIPDSEGNFEGKRSMMLVDRLTT